MQVNERRVNGVTIIEVSGKLTVNDNPGRLKESVTGLVSRGEKRLILNLGGLTYVDSSCLGEVVSCFTTALRAGGRLKLANTGPRLHDLLVLTKLVNVVENYDTEAAALASYGVPAA